MSSLLDISDTAIFEHTRTFYPSPSAHICVLLMCSRLFVSSLLNLNALAGCHATVQNWAVNNHWTGLLDWTTGLDYWTTNLTTRFQLRSKKFYLKSVLAVKLL